MRTGKLATRRLLIAPLAAVFLICTAGMAPGQLPVTGHRPGSRYGGSTTISVATLKVPEGAWKHFEKARLLALKHRPAESVKESAKALAIAPGFTAAYVLQASDQLALRDFDGAIASVIEARKSEPDAQWSGLILAGAYNSLHRYSEALEVILSLDGSEADCWQAHYEHARAAVGLGEVDEALKWSSDAYEVAPRDFTDAIVVRANALMLAKRWTEASDKLYAYLAKPGPQPHRDQVQAALVTVTRIMKVEHPSQPVTLASR